MKLWECIKEIWKVTSIGLITCSTIAFGIGRPITIVVTATVTMVAAVVAIVGGAAIQVVAVVVV